LNSADFGLDICQYQFRGLLATAKWLHTFSCLQNGVEVNINDVNSVHIRLELIRNHAHIVFTSDYLFGDCFLACQDEAKLETLVEYF